MSRPAAPGAGPTICYTVARSCQRVGRLHTSVGRPRGGGGAPTLSDLNRDLRQNAATATASGSSPPIEHFEFTPDFHMLLVDKNWNPVNKDKVLETARASREDFGKMAVDDYTAHYRYAQDNREFMDQNYIAVDTRTRKRVGRVTFMMSPYVDFAGSARVETDSGSVVYGSVNFFPGHKWTVI
jgi:hypothetical protein